MTLLDRFSPCSSISKKFSFAPRSKLTRISSPFVASRLDFHSSQKISVQCLPASLKPDLTGAHGKHILWADLAIGRIGCGTEIYEVDPSSLAKGRLNQNAKMARALQFLRAVKAEHELQSVDSVVFYVEHDLDPPVEVWRALDGLSPKHLEICCGWNKDCNVKSLDALQTQWNHLETLCLEHVVNSRFMEYAPAVFSRISYLSLVNCCGFFIPPGVTRLKHLHISNDNATEMFIWQIASNPNLASMLEVLDIQSMCGFDVGCFYEMPSFKECLEKCTNLHTLRLVVSPIDQVDDHLPSYLPPSIRNLTLCSPPSLTLLDDMDEWIIYASDRTWLPCLTTFKLSVDPERPVRVRDFDIEPDEPLESHLPRKFEPPPSREVFDSEFKRKRGVLYEVLKSGRPEIELRV